ncbi:hypothetical protein [Streptomyces inhibens]|uniref:hypothetical protein n=1 Tax=Streptomyces inhibens TaxID=2293571 RepID=UPI0015F25AE7|nr:hypothetical protein [Streptomyces inhibens]
MDAQLGEAARHDPKVLGDDRHLEGLLRKLSKVLHAQEAARASFSRACARASISLVKAT